jgi:signal transduction histidine kinase
MALAVEEGLELLRGGAAVGVERSATGGTSALSDSTTACLLTVFTEHMAPAVAGMRRILDDVADLDRLETGSAPLQCTLIDIRQLVIDMKEQVKGQFDRKGLALEIVETDVAKSTKLNVTGDQMRACVRMCVCERERVLL